MQDFKFVSDRYDINNAFEYRLSILINRDGFSVLINDTAGEILQIRHINSGTISKAVSFMSDHPEFDPFRRLSFRKVRIIINSEDYFLIPEKIYESDKVELLTESAIGIGEGDRIFDISIPGGEQRLIFKLTKEFKAFTSLFINKPEISHIVRSLLSWYLNLKKNGFFINTSGNITHIALIEDKKLRFFNSFRSENPDEVVYHSVNSFRKLKPGPGIPAVYSGEWTKNHPGFLMLEKYLHTVESIDNILPFGFAGEINESYFLNLLEPVS